MFEYFGKGKGGSDTALVNSILDRSITELVSSVESLGQFCLNGCKNLTKVIFKNLLTTSGCSCRFCPDLQIVDFYCLEQLKNEEFTNCPKLKTLIVRANSLCVFTNSNSFVGTPIADSTDYIYVPAALIEDYKVATNWTVYADQFRAIEDYPEICEVNE